MSEKQAAVTVTPSISFLGMLTLLFIDLKLTGHISWSWWWVLSPSLFSAGLVLAFVLVGAVYVFWPKGRHRW